MKYFLVEDNIVDAGRMTDDITKEYMACTEAAMERGVTFMSGLQTDTSGSLSVIGVEEGGY